MPKPKSSSAETPEARLLAATAVVHDAFLVHDDADFELIAEVEPRLRQAWVVPRAAVD